MLRLREAGKIRFLGITEAFGGDTGHQMMARAVRDDAWDVVMVGFNMLNQSARERVLAETQRRGIGVLCMFAVRDALSRPDKLRETIGELVRQGLIEANALDPQNPLDFVEAVADSLPDAAYRFCRAEPGIHVVLSGTGKRAHLEQNVASILRPPLPDQRPSAPDRPIWAHGHGLGTIDSISIYPPKEGFGEAKPPQDHRSLATTRAARPPA